MKSLYRYSVCKIKLKQLYHISSMRKDLEFSKKKPVEDFNSAIVVVSPLTMIWNEISKCTVRERNLFTSHIVSFSPNYESKHISEFFYMKGIVHHEFI